MTAAPVRYRDGTLSDAAAIADFFAFSFTDTFGHLYPPEDLAAFLGQCDAAGFAGELSGGAHHFRLAEVAGVIVGYCKLGPPSLPFDPGNRRATELRQLYVAPEMKGAGVAAQLMDWALARARADGFQDIYLSVFVDNARARRFYARYGFVEVGLYGFRVGNIIDDDRVMRLALC